MVRRMSISIARVLPLVDAREEDGEDSEGGDKTNKQQSKVNFADAKEGADGLLGLSVIHPDWPKGLGIVIKIAHGWNSQATWYVARSVLGVLGIPLRNPYPLHRQKAFIVPRIVPPQYLDRLESVVTWDEWDPDRDRFTMDWKEYSEAMTRSDPFSNEGMEGS